MYIGGAAPGAAKKVDLDAVPQIGGQSIFEIELDPDKPWKMPGRPHCYDLSISPRTLCG